MKEFLSWEIFDSLEELRLQVRKIIEPELSPTVITSLTGRTSLFSSLSVADI